MLRNIILAFALLFAIAQGPAAFQKMMDDNEGENIARNAKIIANKKIITKRQQNPTSGRVVKLSMGRGGHFYANTRMNNRNVPVMVDTGATSVAIDERTAKRLGIKLRPSDFKYKTHTANGVKLTASAIIKTVQIGRIRVKNVRANISRDNILGGTLLGMSFLRKLKRFEVSGQTLTLVQ